MIEPTFDADGYPTDETLEVIKEWDMTDFKGLMEFCRKAWKWETYFNIKEDENESSKTLICEISTGGWSGNESIIGALQDNMMFWMMCWEQSRRGGHYIFNVKI